MSYRDYPDLVAWSPERRFRCEALSPFNLRPGHPGRPRGEYLAMGGFGQFDFVYSLHRESNEAALWTRPPDEVAKASPEELYVSDSGACVVQTGGAQLVVLSATSGERVLSIDMLEEVFVGPHADRVSPTTIGPMWKQHEARGWFAPLDEREHFWLRMAWAQRVVIDLSLGLRVSDVEAEEHLPAIERIERATTACVPAKRRGSHG